MDKIDAAMSLSNTTGFFRHWMSRPQRAALASVINGEEGEFFIKMLSELKERIETMPKTGETDGQGDDAVAYLHYFMGSIDAWITEKDMGDGTDDLRQHQAYGKVNLGYGAEPGYVSIQELIETGVEMDLYWTPKKLKEINRG